ncbi:Hypothetical protein NGAL_HAMBI1145_55770 [Neorhizobium galegae bv. officinalis]|uniref:Hydantoin racemase n=1 Tax=Neorhizobium galegae bv. officinalis TaxID=323656 RepID=A0A0T7G0P4_NEOGA|nr:aspartate/glutamate racemase family protein [Neorhizobium galegae]CDZ40813.1 Hypothetical protein NGAL_HAMBI1145_55770 [Neorhizobium galegae bv. officinalis]CDZ54610.1 Hypothetical protein NGAL_HAMBI1189_55960 [Neorhizobium galegae bv. officinalis]
MPKRLGLLELENRPIMFPGALSNPGTFDFPVHRMTVRGASVQNIVSGDMTVVDTYIAAAQSLEQQGATAIIANCGFAALLQAKVSEAVSIPVALSSLQLVPFVAKLTPSGRKVGILTYDASKMTERHFQAAGWNSQEMATAVAGIEGSETWRELAKPVPEIDPGMLIEDVVAAADALLQRNRDVAYLVFECAAFPIAADTVRQRTGLPVADYVSLAKMVVEMSVDKAVPHL